MKFEIRFVLLCIFTILVFLNRQKIVLPNSKSSSLERIVRQNLTGVKGQYSVFIKNLKTGETYSLDENRQHESASLYKLWIMAEVFDQIQKGNLKEDEVLSADISELNDRFDIASESAELTEGLISLSVSSALNQMITISHNYAAFLLTKRIKLSQVNLFLKNNGFKESSVGVDGKFPETTAYDIELFFEKLYKGQLADRKNTEKMLNLLKNQKLNNKLPKYLPKGTVIAHKTGEIGRFSHDAGIIYLKNNDYIIVVLSKTNYPPGAEERIAKISQAVYNYFSR